MVNKEFCMSSYLTFRHIINPDSDFFGEIKHREIELKEAVQKVEVTSWKDVHSRIHKTMDANVDSNTAILLSGGMDSGILASYMPKGAVAYTFSFPDCGCPDERERAEIYAKQNGIDLRVVEITWEKMKRYTPILMAHKGEPVHSIEPQIYAAAMQAKEDGMTKMVIGDGADYVFGGMDKLLSKDWTFDEFVRRYSYNDITKILKKPVSMIPFFEKYRRDDNSIDFMQIMNGECTCESYNSYYNAFSTAGLPYVDPYEDMIVRGGIDLCRIRKGESKYIVRELFKERYPDLDVPEKKPMPRAVDYYFKYWNGPKRDEFIEHCINSIPEGNQRWLVYCLEWFLNIYDPVLK